MRPSAGISSKPTRSDFSIRGHMFVAAAVIAGLVFGVGGWAATANISGAVIAPGSIVVERNVKKVQHSFGGIVAEINVKNGDQIRAGEVLLRLDATQIRAELGVLEAQVIELTARAARLRAERDGVADITWPVGFIEKGATVESVVAGEARLFRESRRVKASQKEQLRAKLEQIRREIEGLDAQRKAKAEELVIINREVSDLRSLFANKLTTATKLNALDRDLKRIEGDHGNLIAQSARASTQISEIELQILSIDESVVASSQRDLVATEAKLLELSERIVATRDKLNRIDIRAPLDGIVHELSVHTIGGVVSAAEQLMLIVPQQDKLTVQARIQPQEVDQVRVGRSARMRLTAFNQQTTPEILGEVSLVSGDVAYDSKTGASYYLVRVEIDENAREKLGNVKLLPGMPVEVFLATGERTVMSYLTKPVTDQMNRAFRE